MTKDFIIIKVEGVTYEIHKDKAYRLHGLLSKIATGKIGEINE